jgi:uroporphyrinogen-III synthase
MTIKRILVSQPKPSDDQSPYHTLAKRHNLSIEFMPFIAIHPLPKDEYKNQKISITDHTAVILTSRHAANHFFRICNEMRIELKPDFKYFCATPLIANYLNKFITIRKRKVFVGRRSTTDIFPYIFKHEDEKYLYPTSQNPQKDIVNFLEVNGIYHSVLQLYKVVANKLNGIQLSGFDLLVFFSPAEINALIENFPRFRQGKTLLAGFGTSTCNAIRQAGFNVDIAAPMDEYPSMTGTLDYFLRNTGI